MAGRDQIRMELLQQMPKHAVCAEIGVWDGGFSEQILAVTNPRRLHLIDPWLFQPEFNNSAFGRQAHRDQMDDKFTAVSAKFAGDARVVIHRAMSDAALEGFADAELDWVYIDGNHNYEVVSKDLSLCLQKVKPDGIIAGDDFYWNAEKGAPVKTAVEEVVAALGDRVAFSRQGQQYRLQLMRS